MPGQLSQVRDAADAIVEFQFEPTQSLQDA